MANKKRNGLSHAQHLVIGVRLKAMSDEISTITVQLLNAHPPGGSRTRRLNSARREINAAREALAEAVTCEGETAFFAYFPECRPNRLRTAEES